MMKAGVLPKKEKLKRDKYCDKAVYPWFCGLAGNGQDFTDNR